MLNTVYPCVSRAICALELDGQIVMASASGDKTARVWDPHNPGTTLALHTGHTHWVNAVCPLELNDRLVIASASADNTVRIWDHNAPVSTIPVHAAVLALAADPQQLIVGLEIGVIQVDFSRTKP
jgi:WD40 repeat protein